MNLRRPVKSVYAGVEVGIRPVQLRRYAGIVFFLIALIPATWLLGWLHAGYLNQHAQGVQIRQLDRAAIEITSHWNAALAEIHSVGDRFASSPHVIEELKARSLAAGGTGRERVLTSILAQVSLPEYLSIEIYDAEANLIGWSGFDIPLHEGLPEGSVPDTLRMFALEDVNVRNAVALWLPVMGESGQLGAVRSVRLIRREVPVRNQYLQDYDIADEWRRSVELPFSISLKNSEMRGVRGDSGSRAFLLYGLDRSALAVAEVGAVSSLVFVSQLQSRYANVRAFWAMLLSIWLFTGLIWWHRTTLRDPSHRWRGAPIDWSLLSLAGVGTAWWTLRYVMLQLNIPARFLESGTPGASIFDPTYLASPIAAGAARSAGDFLITALFGVGFAILLLQWCYRHGFLDFSLLRGRGVTWRTLNRRPSPSKFLCVLLLTVVVVMGLIAFHAVMVRQAILDSTLDYFARTGLAPDAMVLVVMCAILLLTLYLFLASIAIILIAGRFLIRFYPRDLSLGLRLGGALLMVVIPLASFYAMLPGNEVLPLSGMLAFLGLVTAGAVYTVLERRQWTGLLTLRAILFSVFILTALTYPLVYWAMDIQRKIRMVDASEAFAEGRDVRAVFGIEQMLLDARLNPSVSNAMQRISDGTDLEVDPLERVAHELISGSFLTTLDDYELTLSFFDPSGRRMGTFHEFGRLETIEPESMMMDFELMRQMYMESGEPEMLVESVTARREFGRFQYEGIAWLVADDDNESLGWVYVRAEPRSVIYTTETPFPRVLVPAGLYADWRGNLSLATFQNGSLVRSRGRDFGRFRLSQEVLDDLATRPFVWKAETIGGRRFLTYYRKLPAELPDGIEVLAAPTQPPVIAVRAPALLRFDHLYYLLRLTLAGIIVGIPIFLIGLVVRRRKGLLPAPKIQFRDKVIDAFLFVGMIAIIAMGLLGIEVVALENQQALRSHIEQHLQQVEDVLGAEARVEEMPYQVIERARIDSLALHLALDLNVYRGHELVASSRPQLVRQRLIDARLPPEVYDALYIQGFRHAFADERIGNFTYTTGYRALADERGEPLWVVSVPTLPEQERIEEERARTIAYLFGALLLLLLIFVLTATLLGAALARPIARLRAGLQAVAAGRFEHLETLGTRDEISDLVDTFNDMQDQLVESRKRLATQERDLAWREMARQVAHEIKNPLTPMKLSIQHVRRAFQEMKRGHSRENGEREKFDRLFDRITATLIEQIDSLAYIANEFSSFARLPSRKLQTVDLNEVILEACSLLQEEENVDIELDLANEPLTVEADREELRRIYINLVKNAFQAMPEGGSVVIHSERATSLEIKSNGWAHSTVTDFGTGIPAEVRERIFQPNFSTKTSGMGLGLAIVKKTIEELSGEVGFETRQGVGTTFWVRLPLLNDQP